MRVRLATPAGTVLLSCQQVAAFNAAQPSYAYYGMLAPLDSRDGIARDGGVRRAPGAATRRIDRNLAAHRYYQPSEP